jgi:hypothetical protein
MLSLPYYSSVDDDAVLQSLVCPYCHGRTLFALFTNRFCDNHYNITCSFCNARGPGGQNVKDAIVKWKEWCYSFVENGV